MKILVVDQDGLTAQMIRSKLEPKGHVIVEEPSKNNAVDRMASDDFDVLMIDPSPLTTPRSLILNVRRMVRNYPYVLMMSESISHEDATKSGANDLLAKPIDPVQMETKIANAERLIKIVQNIGDDSEDFPSAGGVIAKSAFNQLLLSAMDRADRYGERTFVLQISLSNYKGILELDGSYGAEFAVAKLCQYLVLLRRQSDIIGQTGKNEYSLLLQRPIYETEPVEAANRFAQELAKFGDIDSSGQTTAEITVSLVDVPAGSQITSHVFKPGEETPQG